MAYIEKDSLVNYIIKSFYHGKNYHISPIKLQKTLYLLYAMWAGNSANINESNKSDEHGICEQDMLLDEDLFEPNFEAWRYGPVDPDVYFKFKNNNYTISNTYELDIEDCKSKDTIIGFVNEIMSQCFDISDFALVDLTHNDISWIKTFEGDPTGRTKIKKEDILQEYKERLSSNV